MKKIYHCIPGTLVNDGSIINQISAFIGSITFDTWIEMNENIYSLDFFKSKDKFYVLYLDPESVIQRLYHTDCSEIVSFMKEHIDSEKGDGVDIAICTKEINDAVICNHDGQIFILKI